MPRDAGLVDAGLRRRRRRPAARHRSSSLDDATARRVREGLEEVRLHDGTYARSCICRSSPNTNACPHQGKARLPDRHDVRFNSAAGSMSFFSHRGRNIIPRFAGPRGRPSESHVDTSADTIPPMTNGIARSENERRPLPATIGTEQELSRSAVWRPSPQALPPCGERRDRHAQATLSRPSR